MRIPKQTREWPRQAPEPYIRYQAQRLIDPGAAATALLDCDPFVGANLQIVAGWRGSVLERHDKPGLFIHRLAMLADLGVTGKMREAGRIVEGLVKN
jgi:hypothetical protein